MNPVLLLNLVGLTPAMVTPDTPTLQELAQDGFMAPLGAVFPAVTCSAQTSMMTGLLPRDHGIVGNGWYFRELGEVWLWRQSNRLISGERLWERGRRRDPPFIFGNVFWWYAMNAEVDRLLTPRPVYLADGRKLPGIYGRPAGYRDAVEAAIGPFPLFDFWGPRAGLASSRWICEAALWTLENDAPTVLQVYVPHLDYDLQRFGPDAAASLQAHRDLDRCIRPLVLAAKHAGRRILVVSEYGIEAAEAPVHVNRALREAGLLEVYRQLDFEHLDPMASRAFAVADHQAAHVYVRREEDLAVTRRLLESLEGIAQVADRREQAALGIDHPRAGEFVLVAKPGRWFSYYHWLDDARAPDYARTVDIHRKPGYDPAELFLDPEKSWPTLRVAGKLLAKKLGFRTVMDLIPLRAELVRGTHGRPVDDPARGPILMGCRRPERDGPYAMTDLPDLLLDLVFA